MFLSSFVKLSYTFTVLMRQKQEKIIVQLQFQLELPPLDHAHTADPRCFGFKADSVQVGKSCKRV